MNKIYKFEEFTNEELNLKTALAGAALASTLTIGSCDDHKGFAELNKTEIVGDQSFKKYDLNAAGNSFTLRIKDGFMTARHSFSESHGSGKHRHTTTTTVTNLIIPAEIFVKTKFIWYQDKTFGGCYASPKNFTGSHLIKKSDLEIYDDTPGYTLYKQKGFWGGAFNYIIVVKNYNKGEEFKLSDSSLGTFTCDKINKYIYIFGVKNLGSGKMSGGGASGSF